MRVTIYPQAAHSFDVLAPEHRYLGYRVGYDQVATEDSRRQLLAFFREQNGGGTAVAPSGGSLVPVTRRGG